MSIRRAIRESVCGIGLAAGALLSAGAAQGQFIEQRVDSRVLGESIWFDAIDLNGLRASRNNAVGVPTQFAIRQDVALSARQVGVIEDAGNGRVVWRFRVNSENAMNINLAMDWNVPPSTVMYLLDENGEQVFHELGADHNMHHGELWTPPVAGSSMELYAEVAADELDAFLDGVSIFKVNLGFARFGVSTEEPVAASRSDACHVDVACSQGDPFAEQISGVGIVGANGFTFCSGSLVNNTAEDGTPLFLSAYHCFGSDSSFPGNVNSLFVAWNFENTTCRTPGSGASGGNGNGNFNDITLGGGVLRTAISTADIVIYELNNSPLNSYNVAFQGWDRTGSTTGPTMIIHHPAGDEKRISLDNESAGQTTIFFQDQADIRTWFTQFDEGGQEGGSSGAPFFRQDTGRVIGVISGSNFGEPACFPATHFHGRLNFGWNRGTPLTVGQVLDPVGNGSATVLDPMSSVSAPPSGFDEVFPLNRATNVSPTATFDWERSDFAETYELVISTDEAGNNVVYSVAGLGTTEFTLPNNAIDGYSRYYWNVIATNDLGSTEMSAIALRFDTENSGRPARVIPITPLDGQTDIPVDTFFAWNAAGGADFYQLRIVNDATGDFIWGPGDGNINATTFALPDDLPAATTIRWGVIARNASGVNLSDPVFSTFTTAGSAIPTCPADVNESGAVDIEDLLQVLRDFNTSTAGEYEGSDTDGNAMVDIEDLLLVLREFDVPCP